MAVIHTYDSDQAGGIPQAPAGPVMLELVSLRPPAQPPRRSALVIAADGIASQVKRHWLFALLVVLPVALSATYFFVLAADRYETEARFVVRNPSLAINQSIGALLAAGSSTRSSDDAHAINSYIISHGAMNELEKKADLRAVVGRAAGDPLWRFPGPFGKPTSEALYRYYQRMVSVKIDKTSGITSLKVQAFRPEDSVRIANHLLDDAERLANQLSVRSRDDAVRAAASELDLAKRRVDEAQNQITEFRNREQVVDPTRISNSVVETIGRLSLEIAQTNAQLSELLRVASQSPQVTSLKIRIAALERQVVRERQQLAGTDGALAQKIADYEKLVLEKDFADKLLTSAANYAESSRLDVIRQQLYIERIVAPSLPDWPEAPARFFSVFLSAVVALAFFSAIRSILELGKHKEAR
jgi:capsular polysaccharide transport system permease protein